MKIPKFLQNTKLKKALKKEGVVLAYLFGSVARGEAHEESDVDVAVLFDNKVEAADFLKKEGRLISALGKIYQKKEINLVNLNVSSPLLKQNVILEGQPIYEKSPTDKIIFQIATLRLYEEYLHLSAIYNQFLQARIKEL